MNFSVEDGIFFGMIEANHDLVTFEGRKMEELEQGFQSMVDNHLMDKSE